MTNYTIANVKQDAENAKNSPLPNGKYPQIAIPGIQVRIKKLWPAKSHNGAHGAYFMQNGEVEDSTGTIKLNVIGREPLTYKIGDEVILKSGITSKGLDGVFATYESYVNKTTGIPVSNPVLSVTKKAIVVQNGQHSNVNPPPSPQNNIPASQPINEPEALKQVLNEKRNKISLNERIDQYTQIYQRCLYRAIEIDEARAIDIADTMFNKAIEEGLELEDMAKDDIHF